MALERRSALQRVKEKPGNIHVLNDAGRVQSHLQPQPFEVRCLNARGVAALKEPTQPFVSE